MTCKKINQLLCIKSIIFMVTVYQSVNADDFTLLGLGVCRPAGNYESKTYSYRDYSWEKCRRICLSRDCSAIEYNLRNDKSVCEHHYTPVKVVAKNPKDRVLSCWSRTAIPSNSGSFTTVIGGQKLNCTELNDSTAICDCDHEPSAGHAAACKIVLDANCSYHPNDGVWSCPIDPK